MRTTIGTRGLILAAASTLAITASAAAQDVEAPATADEDKGMLETLLSDEQPPLEGDSPLVDDEDVLESRIGGDDALVGEGYAQDDADAAAPLDADDLPTAEDLAEIDAEAGAADAEAPPELASDDEDAMDAEPMTADADAPALLDADAPALASPTPGSDDADAMDAEPAPRVSGVDALTPRAPIPAAATDPVEAAGEAALIAGTYDVTIPNVDGTRVLFIEGRGTEAAGTFDGAPIDVIVTGRNFSFDAPVEMNGETALMTFAGTVEDGVIDNGVIEAQGDGGFLTFDARRADAAVEAAGEAPAFDTGVVGGALGGAAGDAADGAEAFGGAAAETLDGALDDTSDAADDALGDVDLMNDADMDEGVEADVDADAGMDADADMSAGDALTDDTGLSDDTGSSDDTGLSDGMDGEAFGDEALEGDATGTDAFDADATEADAIASDTDSFALPDAGGDAAGPVMDEDAAPEAVEAEDDAFEATDDADEDGGVEGDDPNFDY